MKCLKFGLSWGNNDFVTQFTQVFRQFGVNCRKQKKKFRENCFENMVSNLPKKNCLCVHKTTFRKKCGN